jgi:histidine ammonia-lyase
MDKALILDGKSLTLDQIVRIARERDHKNQWIRVGLAVRVRKNISRIRKQIEKDWLKPDAPPFYGFNTGVGKLKDSRIPFEQIQEFQENLLNSHSTGVGEPLAEEAVRATMLLRLNSFAIRNSGIRIALLDRLIAMLNAGVHPVIPQRGSVGASGDLAPLAHMACTLIGHPNSEAFFQSARMPARDALAAAGLEPTFALQAKEALALVNGSTVSLAIAVLATNDARLAVVNADIALALSLESMRGELAAFDPRIHSARPHKGQVETAANIRKILRGSRRCSKAAREVRLPDEIRVTAQSIPERVQDAYSLRCAPQVHGPVREGLSYIERILSVEINSVTDNPLVVSRPRSNGQRLEVLSGGNFHGQYVAQATDLLALIVTDLGSISERRICRMLDPTMSYGLPSNLASDTPGLNTGYSIAHCSMAALTSENKTLSWPASTDSIPTKSNQEDHVSNSAWSAIKAQQVVSNTQQIIGTEMDRGASDQLG